MDLVCSSRHAPVIHAAMFSRLVAQMQYAQSFAVEKCTNFRPCLFSTSKLIFWNLLVFWCYLGVVLKHWTRNDALRFTWNLGKHITSTIRNTVLFYDGFQNFFAVGNHSRYRSTMYISILIDSQRFSHLPEPNLYSSSIQLGEWFILHAPQARKANFVS